MNPSSRSTISTVYDRSRRESGSTCKYFGPGRCTRLGKPDAEDALEAAVDLAHDEAFVIALVEGMPELTARISSSLRSHAIGEFEQTVLDRLDRPRPKAARSGQADLVDQLTAREVTVLRYLDSRLTVHEIASEMYVSPEHAQDPSQGGVSQARRELAQGGGRRGPAASDCALSRITRGSARRLSRPHRRRCGRRPTRDRVTPRVG